MKQKSCFLKPIIWKAGSFIFFLLLAHFLCFPIVFYLVPSIFSLQVFFSPDCFPPPSSFCRNYTNRNDAVVNIFQQILKLSWRQISCLRLQQIIRVSAGVVALKWQHIVKCSVDNSNGFLSLTLEWFEGLMFCRTKEILGLNLSWRRKKNI